MVIGNGCVLIISRVDVIIVLPPYSLVYLSGRSRTACGGRWPSTECTCRKSESQRFRDREGERDKMVSVRTSTRLSCAM